MAIDPSIAHGILRSLPQGPDVTKGGGDSFSTFFGGFQSGRAAGKEMRSKWATEDVHNEFLEEHGFTPNKNSYARDIVGGLAGAYLNTQGRIAAGADPLSGLKQRMAEQTLALGQLKLDEALRDRDMAVKNELLFQEFSKQLNTSIQNGSAASPEVGNNILDFLGRNPSLLNDKRTVDLMNIFAASKKMQAEANKLRSEREALSEARKEFGPPTELTLDVPGGIGKATFGGKAAGPASPVGKELADYHAALKSGDTESAELIKSAILARKPKEEATGAMSPLGKELSDYHAALARKDTESAEIIKSAIMARNKDVDSGTMSPIGKELADYHAAIKRDDTESAGLIKSAILARSQKDGFIVEFGEDGRVTRIAQGPTGGKSDLPASVIADAQQTSNNAVDVVNYGKELIRLASDPANTGILGNLNRLTVKLGGQLDPSMDPGEAFDFATQTAFFKSRITKLLKSDSNIAEAEREAIVEKLPGPEWHKSTPQNVAEAKKAMIEVAKSARNQIKAAKRPLPPELMTPREILDNVKNGNLKLTNKETARLMKESLFQGPDFADME